MADGKVTIDTAIDSSGLKAGSKEIEAAVKRLASDIDGIGTNAKKSLEKQVASFEKVNQQYAAQEQKVQNLKAKIAELRNQKIPTEEFKEIGKQIDTDTAKLNRLIEQQRLFEEIGGRTRSTTYQRRQLQIEELTNSIKYAKAEQEELLNSGVAYITPDASEQLEALYREEKKLADMNTKVQQSYNGVSTSVSDYRNKTTMLSGIISRLSAVGQKASGAIKNLARSLLQAVKGTIITGLKKIGAGILGIHKSANKSTISIGKMLKYLFGIRSLYTLFNKMRSALVDGFKNLVQYSGETNSAISSVMSALTQLKNSLATAFAPIVTTVAPYLVKFINLISECVTRVGMFVAALTGKNTFTKAVAVQEDYAASLDKSSKNTKKATKAAKNYLSPLDEIERYESNKDTSTPSSGKYTGPSPSDMFQEVPIESSIKGVADKIKNLIKSEDWEGLGAYVASGINAGMQKIYDAINWNNVGPKITKFTTAFTRTFNSLVDHIDWDLMGRTIGAGINTIVYTLNQLITGINWKNLGKGFANGVNGIVKEVDFSALGRLIGNKFMIIPNIAYGFVKNLNWKACGTALGNGLNGVVQSIDLGTIGTAFGTAITGAFQMAINFSQAFDWKALGENIYTGINNLLYSLDFATIGKGFSDLAVGFLDTIITSLGGVDWESLGSKLVEFILNINWIQLAGQLGIIGLELIGGIGAGVIGALKTIGTWLKEHVVDPIVNKVKELFGIHSPSTVMAEIGKMLMQGLYNGIESFVETIKKIFVTLWNGIKTTTETVWRGITSTVSGIWNGLKNTASTIFNGIKNVISGIWNGIKQITGTVWNGIKTTASGIWEKLKTSASTIFEGIKTTISDVWDNLKEAIPEAAKAIKEGIMDRFTEARDGVKGIFEKLADYVKTPINAAIRLVNNGIGTMNNALGGLEKAFSFGPWEIPTPFGSKTIGFSASFPRIGTIPYLAKGAVIPPKSEFLAVLGDQKNGRNLEAPEDLIRQIVREESGSGQNGNYRFTAQINRRTIFDEVIDEAKLRQSTTGRNPFELA